MHPNSPSTAALIAAGLEPSDVDDVIARAFREDLRYGEDVTTNATIPDSLHGCADVVARQSGCAAGIPVALAVVDYWKTRTRSPLDVTVFINDGQRFDAGTTLLSVSGPVRDLLSVERTLLNLLSQLSGVATLTATWVDACAGTQARIRDTRKTIPGLRLLQKYAVRCGGGENHRLGLGDAALIKDNHIIAAGSVAHAFQAVRAYNPAIAIEVECDTYNQVVEAVDAGADLILLDNMSVVQIAQALTVTRPKGVRTEASGGLTLDNAAAIAATGVDYLAVGALTHSAAVCDLGFDLRS